MTKCKLLQKTNTKFHVLYGEDIVGSISVEPNQIDDLLRHWSGPVEGRPKQESQNPMVTAMMKLKPVPMTKAAVLRGCL